MSEKSTIHNTGSNARVVDAAGHILGGGETGEFVADEVTARLLASGAVVVIPKPAPEPEQPKPARARGKENGA